MKDVSVVLELVVHESTSDQQIKSFVEEAVRHWNDGYESRNREAREPFCEEPIEVTGIADESYSLRVDRNIPFHFRRVRQR